MHELLSRGQLNKVFIVDLSGLTDNTNFHNDLSRGQLNKVFMVDLSGLTDNTEIFTMI